MKLVRMQVSMSKSQILNPNSIIWLQSIFNRMNVNYNLNPNSISQNILQIMNLAVLMPTPMNFYHNFPQSMIIPLMASLNYHHNFHQSTLIPFILFWAHLMIQWLVPSTNSTINSIASKFCVINDTNYKFSS